MIGTRAFAIGLERLRSGPDVVPEDVARLEQVVASNSAR